MTLEIRNPKDFWAGVLYMAIGLAAFWIARGYSMGSAGRMGPGYFPTFISGGLAFLGLLAFLRSFFRPGEAVEGLALKQLALITVAIVSFGVLIRSAGFVVALPLLVVLSAYASTRFRLWPTVVLALALTLFCALIFLKGLGIPLPLLGRWFGG